MPWLAVVLALLAGALSSACGEGTDLPARPVPRQTRPIRLLAGGDVYLGGSATAWARTAEAGPSLAAFLGARGSVDAFVANLEGALTRTVDPTHPDKAYAYRMPPEDVQVLAGTGIDLVSLANNHAMDFGAAGLQSTRATLREAGIDAFGAGADLAAATQPRIVEVAGLRVGLLGFMEHYPAYAARWAAFAGEDRPGVAPLRRDVVRPALAALRPRVDLIVVSVHWGIDYGDVTPTQRTWGRQLAAYGADLVVGHHPHVAQGVALHGDTIVLYSLGNFVFGGTTRFASIEASRRLGWIADIEVEDGRIVALSLVPVHFPDAERPHLPAWGAPEPLPRVVERLQRGLERSALRAEGDRAVVVLPRR